MSDPDDLYQELILDHNKRPRNRRQIDEPDRVAVGHNPLCGDHVTVFINLDGDVVKEAAFDGSGCAISTASASIMTDMIKGRSLADAKALFKKFHAMVTGAETEADLGPALGKLAVFSGLCQYPARVKCATLVWHTANAAMENREEPTTTE